MHFRQVLVFTAAFSAVQKVHLSHRYRFSSLKLLLNHNLNVFCRPWHHCWASLVPQRSYFELLKITDVDLLDFRVLLSSLVTMQSFAEGLRFHTAAVWIFALRVSRDRSFFHARHSTAEGCVELLTLDWETLELRLVGRVEHLWPENYLRLLNRGRSLVIRVLTLASLWVHTLIAILLDKTVDLVLLSLVIAVVKLEGLLNLFRASHTPMNGRLHIFYIELIFGRALHHLILLQLLELASLDNEIQRFCALVVDLLQFPRRPLWSLVDPFQLS